MFKNRPRLKNFDYKGHYRYFITICTHDKVQLFRDNILVEQLIKSLRDKSDVFGFKVWTFCFMPDHLHLLLEGKSPDSDLKRFISSFKQHTGYHFKKNVVRGFSQAGLKSRATVSNKRGVVQEFNPVPSRLWQASYYDHVLRKDEDVMSVAKYILDNPVRKRLVTHFMEYKSAGSFELDIEQLF